MRDVLVTDVKDQHALDKVIAQTPAEAQQEVLEFSEALSRANETLNKDKSVGFDM